MGYVNNSVAPWLRGIYCNDDMFDMLAERWPFGVAQHDERYPAKR